MFKINAALRKTIAVLRNVSVFSIFYDIDNPPLVSAGRERLEMLNSKAQSYNSFQRPEKLEFNAAYR